MEPLSEYILSSFLVALLAGIGEKIAPKQMKNHISFVAALILLLFLIAPLTSIWEQIQLSQDLVIPNDQIPSTPSESYDEILNLTQSKSEEAIKQHLLNTFRLKGTLFISLTLQYEPNGTIWFTHVEISIDPIDREFAEEIRAYTKKTFHTETTIILKEDGN